MKKFRMFILLLPVILFSCTTAGEEPALPEADGQPEAVTAIPVETPVLTTEEPVATEETPVNEESTVASTAEANETVELPTAVPVTVEPGQITPEPAEPGDLIVPGLSESTKMLVQAVRLDLSQRLNVDAGEIEVVTIEEVTWRDSSLGCPRPNASYLQVLTPGFLIVLEAKGQQYFYHTRGVDHFILCERGRSGVPSTGVDR